MSNYGGYDFIFLLEFDIYNQGRFSILSQLTIESFANKVICI